MEKIIERKRPWSTGALACVGAREKCSLHEYAGSKFTSQKKRSRGRLRSKPASLFAVCHAVLHDVLRLSLVILRVSVPGSDLSSDSQVCRGLQRRSADSADDGGAIAAGQRVGYFAGAVWAVERLGRRGLRLVLLCHLD